MKNLYSYLPNLNYHVINIVRETKAYVFNQVTDYR